MFSDLCRGLLVPTLLAESEPLAADGPLMREVFGNIPPASKLVFYLLALVSLATFGYGIYRRVRLWRMGRPAADRLELGAVVNRWLRDVLFQRRIWGRGLASLAHVLLFGGFVVLLIGTTLIAVEHILAGAVGRPASDPIFHKGLYYAIYEVTLDAFGIFFLVGCTMFLVRRVRNPGSIGRNSTDYVVLVTLIVIGVTGYLLEGLRIIHAATPSPGVSFVGLLCARMFEAGGIDRAAAGLWHWSLWWLHAVLALGFIAAMPYTRLLHALAGTLNLPAQTKQLGKLVPVTMEEVEETGLVGVGNLTDFSRRELMALDACVSCGRCEDACPAFEAGKPLSPRDVVQDLRGHMSLVGAGADGASLHGDVIEAETIWSCTTCTACIDVCPLGIRPMDYLTDMRRYLIGEGSLRGAPANSLQKSQRVGNPWGLPPEERFDWAEGLEVPTVAERPDFEVLYWVGCAASYDRRVRNIARSVVRLLQAAEVNFAVLGNEERCTGESARRMGDEFLFQELAMQNVETLAQHNVRKIVAHCPHCLNSLRHDYPQMGGNFEVIHHSQLLRELVDAGRLPLVDEGTPADAAAREAVTFHDPCYLARVGGTTEEPRELVQLAVGGANANATTITEMPRNRRQTACCGGGGGRMWFDDAVDERVGQSRVAEALATGADTVAVSCPFCLIMLSDGVKAQDAQTQVRDIAEMLADRLPQETSDTGAK
ncbi:MAG: 4Fe-4S dicluster domain-containing protein [Planctomycetota bacterium]|nr:MAG: 4Fe-4S dicluster domain-containing protein [Planctomycetota bacterium]